MVCCEGRRRRRAVRWMNETGRECVKTATLWLLLLKSKSSTSDSYFVELS